MAQRSLLSPLASVFGRRSPSPPVPGMGVAEEPARPLSPTALVPPSRLIQSAPPLNDDEMEDDSASFVTSLPGYQREEVSAEMARQWLSSRGLNPSSLLLKGPLFLHSFPISDSTRLSFCAQFMLVKTNRGEIVHVQLQDKQGNPAAEEAAAACACAAGTSAPNTMIVDSTTGVPTPAAGASVSSPCSPANTSPAAAAAAASLRKPYKIASSGFVISKNTIKPTMLREHLAASAATMACLRAGETELHASEVATRVYHMLKEHFVEIPSFKYEVGAPSHRWTGSHGGIAASLLKQIASECFTIMNNEPTLLRIKPPVYIVGDLHGNYKDFVYFAKSFGLWHSAEFVPAKFLFLGDYVDRGPHSIETLAFVLSLKCRFPDKIHLLRGNHECAEINGDEELYLSGSFKTQCKLLYGVREGEELWRAFNRCFEVMPLAAVIDDKVFCVHAGIPRHISRNPSCDILSAITAVRRPPCLQDDFVFDLLWSDPATPAEERIIGMDGFPAGFGRNTRGPATCVFGKEAVRMFCEKSGCTHIVRAHQSPKIGVDVSKNATILTVFSSSHYCGGYNRAASVLVYDGKLDIIVSNPDAPEPEIVISSDDYSTS